MLSVESVELTWITCCWAVVSKGATLIGRTLPLIEISSVVDVARGSNAVAVPTVPDSDRSWLVSGRTRSCDNGIAMNDDGAIGGASPVCVCNAAASGHPRPRHWLPATPSSLQFIEHARKFYNFSRKLSSFLLVTGFHSLKNSIRYTLLFDKRKFQRFLLNIFSSSRFPTG